MKKRGKKTRVNKKRKAEGASPLVRRVRPGEIVVDGGFRELDKKIVSELAASIKQVGLLHPPTVFIKPPKGESSVETVHLVAGNHRLAAAKELGWEFIDVTVVKRIKTKNRMRHITENLHRKNLTAVEEGRLTKEWIELQAKKGGQLAQPHDKGISRAARKFGKSPKSIRRSIKAGSIDVEAEKALKKAGLDDNEKVVLEVADEKPGSQAAKVAEIVQRRERRKRTKAKREVKKESEKIPHTKSPLTQPESDDEDVWSDAPFDKLKEAWEGSVEMRKAWDEANAGDRQRFVDEVLLFDEDEEEIGE